MNPESIHETYDDDIEPAADGSMDEEATLQADPEGAEAQDISEGPAADSGEPAQPEGGQDSEASGDSGQPERQADEKTVPYGALHAEREMRKELQAQLAENQKALGQMMALKEQLDELRKGSTDKASQAEQEALEAKFEEDPIGVLREQQEALRAKLDSADAQKEQMSEQQKQMQAFFTEVTNQVQAYEKDHPDYSKAFQFLMEKRMDEYRAMGVSNPQELQASFDREAIQLAQGAMARGKNPAEVAYEMAKMRGYDPALNDKIDDKQESLEQTMDRLEKGSKAAQTNQGGTTTGIDDSPSLSDISRMSDKDFDAYWAEMEKAAGRGSIM